MTRYNSAAQLHSQTGKTKTKEAMPDNLNPFAEGQVQLEVQHPPFVH